MPAKSSAAAASRVTPSRNGTPAASSRSSAAARVAAAAAASKEPKVLFQKYFKSIGTRSYAAHLKETDKGNQFLVLTES